MTVDEYWQQFRSTHAPDAELTGSYAFGDTPELADELVDIVLNGPKRATTGMLAEFEHDGEALPQPGDYNVVLDGRGQPVCILRTTQVDIKPLREVDEQFAWDEGEGDRSLEYWRKAHEWYFKRRCEVLGLEFSDELLVVLDRFELVWPERS